MFKPSDNSLISHSSKVMLKILHARFQHYTNQELSDVKLGLERTDETEIILPTFTRSQRKQGNSHTKNLSFVDYTKAFYCVDHNKLWKALQEMGIPGHLTCLLRNLFVGQEARVRTLYGKTDWFSTEKGVQQGCLLSPCLFNLYAESIMRNARLDELQAGIKIDGRNINNLGYVDDTILMAESKDKLKSLLMRVEEESKRASLKLNIT